MKLFSKEIDKKLFNQYPKGADLSSQVAVAKIFNPYGKGRWYLINSDPEDPNYLWAIVQMGDIVEVGSVSRNELESLRIPPFRLPLERDLGFGGVNAAELFKGLRAGKFYKAGGWTEGSENKEMLLNQAEGFEHHAEEFESAVKKADYVPAWVVAKSQRASTDLSDITHYLDGENEQREEEVQGEEEYGNGGIIGGLTADELIYLYVKKAIVQKYREKYLKPAGLLGTPKSKYVEQSLIKKGFLNNAGAITELGKNKAREVDSEIGLMISRGYISSTNLPSKYKEIVKKFESDDKMADGGEVKWQDAHYGDNALVVSENKMGIIIKPYGRKFHLKFADGTEKTYDASELQFFKDMDDFDMGGEVEGVDLFEDYENIPEKVQQILDNYADAFEDGDYKGLEKANEALLKIGYTFDYGLDGQAYDLRKVGEKGKSEEYALGGMMAKGGMVVTSIKDIPNFKQRLEERKITYRGLGMGKKSDDFYDLAGENGKSIKVDGKEYYITDTEFDSFSRGSDGKLRIRFDAPYKKSYADGGMTDPMGTVNEISRLSGLRPVAVAEWGDKNNINLSILLKDLKSKKVKGMDLMTAIVGNPNNKYQKELLAKYSRTKMAMGGLVKEIKEFEKYNYPKPKTKGDKVRAIFQHFEKKGYTKEQINNALGEIKYALGGMMAKGGDSNGYNFGKAGTGFDNPKNKNMWQGSYDKRGLMLKPTNDLKTLGGKLVIRKKYDGKYYWEYLLANGNVYKKSDSTYYTEQEAINNYEKQSFDKGGVTFAEKVKPIKSSLLKRKKVSPKVQKDYGKTYSPKEAEESAKRIVGAMTAKERLMAKRKKSKK